MSDLSTTPARLYLCPQCSSPERGPLAGGRVACSRCRTPFDLPNRTALPSSASIGTSPTPPDDPARLAALRAQDGRPRQVPATLQTVLGGTSILPGREQEALVVWQSLRTRSMSGDAAASEDLSVLTLIMAQSRAAAPTPEIAEALSESAFDAVMLPRHKQEQLGRLARGAAGRGDRAAVQRYLAWMVPAAPDLETDSELRVSAAALATLDRDGRRAIALLGREKDAIPIADSLDPLASVLRANAYEILGDAASAARILRELPDAKTLTLMRTSFPALRLCAQSGDAYGAAMTQESAKRAAASAGNIGMLIGGIFAASGIVMAGISLIVYFVGSPHDDDPFVTIVIGGVMAILGVFVLVRARQKAKRAAWLRLNGLSLAARVLDANATGTTINDVPVYRFSVQIAGPQGPYQTTFDKLVPEHQVAMLIGGELRVRANPNELTEIILEE